MRLEPHDFKRRLDCIPWFDRCGDSPLPFIEVPTLEVVSWQEAQKYFLSHLWEDVGQTAQGDLTSHLAKRCHRRYNSEWNRTVMALSPRIKAAVDAPVQSIIREHNVDVRLHDCVCWDILHGLMVWEYEDCRPPQFGLHLLKVYESGHFPCGWIGALKDWPHGTLVVF